MKAELKVVNFKITHALLGDLDNSEKKNQVEQRIQLLKEELAGMPEATQQVEDESVTADEVNLLKARIGKATEKVSFIKLKHEFR